VRSKLHTIPLPQLANTSGIIVTPLSSSIFSAPGVVGPFALSMINFALILFAFPLVITLYTATGIKISQFVSNNSLLVIASTTVLCISPVSIFGYAINIMVKL